MFSGILENLQTPAQPAVAPTSIVSPCTVHPTPYGEHNVFSFFRSVGSATIHIFDILDLQQPVVVRMAGGQTRGE